MSKKKIAESIIIKVGGGIREVRREPLEAEAVDSSHIEADFEQAEDMRPFGSEPGSTAAIGTDKIIN